MRGRNGEGRPPDGLRVRLVAENVRGLAVVRPARYLHLAAIVAFVLAVIALALEESLVATVLFMVAAVGFLATLILQRRR